MDELSNFKRLLNNIRDDVPESNNVSNRAPENLNKGSFINKKSFERPVLKTVSSKLSRERAMHADKNTLWSENKEVSLFSLLASVVLSIVGIIASVDYLTLAGAIGFLLSAGIIFLLMFNYAESVKKIAPLNDDMKLKIDELSRKIDTMDLGNYCANNFSPQDGRVQEMEGKIDELRTIVKALIKTAENNSR